jgi:hypothetical protein
VVIVCCEVVIAVGQTVKLIDVGKPRVPRTLNIVVK